MSASEQVVIRKDHDNWTEIVLNRPNRLNAIIPELAAELILALRAAEKRPDTRAVLLTGAGRGFCAGQDLALRDPRRGDFPPDLSGSVRSVYNPLIRTITGLSIPVVCAVNGVAAGAGAGIALACDIVVAARGASFSFGFVKIGLTADAGTAWHLVHRLGAARARALLLRGAALTADQAAQWGLIWDAVDDDVLRDHAVDLVLQLANGPADALRLTRRALDVAPIQNLHEQLELESRLQGALGRSCDYREGVLSFHEKRRAKFDKRPLSPEEE